MGTLAWAFCTSLEFLELFHKKVPFLNFPIFMKKLFDFEKIHGEIFLAFLL